MNLVLNLTPDTEAKLKERAVLAGKRPEELALEVLRDEFAAEPETAATLPLEAWLHEFDIWLRGHKSRNPHFDDSRESIYPDRR
jgi:hypothetical protein